MAYKDWDPDDLLNFDYGKDVPEREPVIETPQEDYNKYDEARARSERTKIDAQTAAYERYRSENRTDGVTSSTKVNRKDAKKAAKRTATRAGSAAARGAVKATKVSAFNRILSVLFLLITVAFAVIMTIMNVLPMKYLILMFVVLALLSFILIKNMNKGRNKKWVRVVCCLIAVLLIGGYGLGGVYALQTLGFLDDTSVKNENKVASITKEPFNVLITGMDTKGTIDTEGRSDVNMLVTVNPTTGTILMTSIPRDYQVNMPDKNGATDKLTHTGFYSVDTTIGAVDDLLDVKSNYYVKVNFSTVIRFINAVGGVDVYSDYDFYPEKLKSFHVKKGVNWMTGSQALAFARERHVFEDGDNQRIKNQQAVLEAVIKKATSSRTILISYSKILNSMADYFEMSFSSSEIRNLIKFQLAKSPDWKIYKNQLIGWDGVRTTYTGGSQELYVMLHNESSVEYSRKLIKAVMEGKELKKQKDGYIKFEGANEITYTDKPVYDLTPETAPVLTDLDDASAAAKAEKSSSSSSSSEPAPAPAPEPVPEPTPEPVPEPTPEPEPVPEGGE